MKGAVISIKVMNEGVRCGRDRSAGEVSGGNVRRVVCCVIEGSEGRGNVVVIGGGLWCK